MLDANLTQQLKAYLANLREPIELVSSLGEDAKSRELGELLGEIAALSDKISISAAADERTPSFLIRRTSDHAASVRFAGIPLGHEFTSLVLALLWAGGHPPKVSDETIATIKGLQGSFHFETYFSLSCQNCPDVVQALTLMSILNPNITHTAIDGALFGASGQRRAVDGPRLSDLHVLSSSEGAFIPRLYGRARVGGISAE